MIIALLPELLFKILLKSLYKFPDTAWMRARLKFKLIPL